MQTKGATDVEMHLRVCSYTPQQVLTAHIFPNKDARYVHMDA